MPAQKLPPNAGDWVFDSDKRRARERYRKRAETQQQIAKKAAKKRVAAAKKGAEGPKKSKPGGYARTPFNQPSSKKKRKV
jgi:hypothetical protein